MEKNFLYDAISELTKSTHGNLTEYRATTQKIALEDPLFTAHLCSWNALNGSVRDSKIAMPLYALDVFIKKVSREMSEALIPSLLASLAGLSVRDLARAVRFAKSEKLVGSRKLRGLVKAVLHHEEDSMWDTIALRHRRSLKELYALLHIKPRQNHVNVVLFGRNLDGSKAVLDESSPFSIISNLHKMSSAFAADAIKTHRLPFLSVLPAIRCRLEDPIILEALLTTMTPNDVVSHAKLLGDCGVSNYPETRARFERAMERARTAKNFAYGKIEKAVDSSVSEEVKQKLLNLRELKMDDDGIEGSWLILGDASGSMKRAITMATNLTAALARAATGRVFVSFFKNYAVMYEVTGFTVPRIAEICATIQAGGATSVGAGLKILGDVPVDGIAIVTDGGENAYPLFAGEYEKYSKAIGKEVPIFIYYIRSTEADTLTPSLKDKDVQRFLVDETLDQYSMLNALKLMRTSKQSLIDEIMSTRLLQITDVL